MALPRPVRLPRLTSFVGQNRKARAGHANTHESPEYCSADSIAVRQCCLPLDDPESMKLDRKSQCELCTALFPLLTMCSIARFGFRAGLNEIHLQHHQAKLADPNITNALSSKNWGPRYSSIETPDELVLLKPKRTRASGATEEGDRSDASLERKFLG